MSEPPKHEPKPLRRACEARRDCGACDFRNNTVCRMHAMDDAYYFERLYLDALRRAAGEAS